MGSEPSSWCLQPNIGVSFSVWPLPRAGMVVLDQFFSKMYFLYIWRSPPKNLTEFWGVLAPQNKVYFRALSVSQKMWMSRPHVGKYRWILYDISYELIINCNESTMIILGDLMKATCLQVKQRIRDWSIIKLIPTSFKQCLVQLKTTLNYSSARHFCHHQRVISFQTISLKSKPWQSSTLEGASTDAQSSSSRFRGLY